ncbi:gephyrin-like molybdotransferase Glp [Parageobacillus sp. G301]|jgi:molybdopterin molybdotransferase|uniref:molybdopterin molybdotransferase MoeA n=1 Tax=Parageobacillus sp. G301 TaxID=2998290 RepID=UPI00249804C8|nr:gephyrin-like molybdotransferase Glp [Parageobacillus sp. G301]GLH62705.1 molybdopterin molybdenumtransferase [Parageobacillus sp. G301]
MRFQREIVDVWDAQKRLESWIRPLGTEKVKLTDSIGRYLGENVVATHDFPHFRRSMMDGFAVRSADTKWASEEHPVALQVIESIPCGAVPTKKLTANTAARIMTGAMMPEGADSVVMIELTEQMQKHGQTYTVVKKETRPNENVIPIGLEMAKGTLILEKGRKINPGEAALLAAFGYDTVTVSRRPTVAIFATGSELLDVSEPLEPGKIRNSNSYMVAAQVLNAGGLPVLLEKVPDDVGLAKSMILDAMEKVDLVITTGGASVGDYDILVDIFEQWDGKMLFNKVAMRPGSPTTVGVWRDKFLFALSGNPGACFVGFELFVRPVIWGMQGKTDIYLPSFSAFLAEDYKKKDSFYRIVRGKSEVKDGKIYVRSAGIDQSNVLSSIRDTDCLIIIPRDRNVMNAGEMVKVLRLNVPE